MIRYFFFSLIILLIGVILQQWTPSMGTMFYNARFLIIPMFFFCIAHSQQYIPTLIFALITGLLWDAQNIISPFINTTERPLDNSVENLKFGYSIILFGGLGFFIKFVQANFRYYGMAIYCITIFLSLIIYLLMENLFLLFVRGTGTVDHRFLYQILFTAILSTFPAPIVLYILGLIARPLTLRKNGLSKGVKTLIRRKY